MEFPSFAEYIYQLNQTIETDEVKIAKYEALNKEKNDECVQNASPGENPVQPTELAGEVMQLKWELEKAKRPHSPEVCLHTHTLHELFLEMLSVYLTPSQRGLIVPLTHQPQPATNHVRLKVSFVSGITSSNIKATI